MMSTKFKFYLLIGLVFGLLLFQVACKKQTEEIEMKPYVFEIPKGFPDPVLANDNPLSSDGIALGRALYYDTLLSFGGPRQGLACASCHHQEVGFTLPSQPVLAHSNLAWNSNFLWKGEIAGTLEDAMVFEVQDFFEVDITHLGSNSKYRNLFYKAFGSEEVTMKKTASALAQFIRTLVSADSKYDQFLKGEKILSASEMNGYKIFFSEVGDCFHCHGNALFTDNQFHNIGLLSKSANDLGRYLFTGTGSDVGKFKTPTLRNVALRQVFMHDGRFKSLREVINHYNIGVKKSEFLDPILDKPNLDLSETQIDDLIAFLNCLTDENFLKNPAFSKP